MKLFCLFSFAFSSLYSLGQGVVPYGGTENPSTQAGTTIMHGVTFPVERYVRLVDGSPYFVEDWLPGSLTREDGKIFTEFRYRLNLADNSVLFMGQDGLAKVATDPVTCLSLTDPLNTRHYYFVHTSLQVKNADAAKVWLQVLVRDTISTSRDGISLYKLSKRIVMESKPYGSASIEQSVKTTESYYMGRNDQLVPVKSWSDLVEAIPGKRQQVAEFINTRHLKGKKQEDYIQLIQYYNSL